MQIPADIARVRFSLLEYLRVASLDKTNLGATGNHVGIESCRDPPEPL